MGGDIQRPALFPRRPHSFPDPIRLGDGRLFDEMGWKPYDYVMRGGWRNDDSSIHRTVKWSEIAAICSRLREAYLRSESIEPMNQAQMRTLIFGQKDDPKAPNKKINMMRRWMVRNDGKVDLGIWKSQNSVFITDIDYPQI